MNGQELSVPGAVPYTPRLVLRELTRKDASALARTLQDGEAMYAYEHAFSDEEVRQWLQNQLRRYREDGFGLWGVLLRGCGTFIGQCGLTVQPWGERRVIEVGYLFERAFWHRGYATEAAVACKEYAFSVLGAEEVYSIIRDTNTASQKVAERNGMQVCGRLVKHYCGKDMPHLVYRAVKR